MRNDQIELNDGRIIELERLTQWQTYGGLLEGTPSVAMNRKYLAGVSKSAAERSHEPIILVEPHQERVVRLYCKGELGWLPRITCEGHFDSYEHARDPAAHVSSLRIIWLQHSFALPIEADALVQIKAVNWAAHAADGWV